MKRSLRSQPYLQVHRRGLVHGGLFSLLVLSLICSSRVVGIELESSQQGWQLTFDTANLVSKAYENLPNRYRFYAKSAEGVLVSLHVDEMPFHARNAGECIAHYWPGGSPHSSDVNLNDIRFQSYSQFERVSYGYPIQYAGRTLEMPNTHVYFAVNGRCADLHMGAPPGSTEFAAAVDRVVRSLRIKVLSHLVQAPSQANAPGNN